MALPTQRDIEKVLLGVLAQLGGTARPREVYPLVTKLFPSITPAELAETLSDGRTNKWANAIQWTRQHFVEDGSIDASKVGTWALTDKGWRRARGEENSPLQRRVRKPAARPRRLPEPSPIELVTEGSPIAVLPSEAESIVKRLLETQHSSGSPNDFERAVRDAFDFLGFDASHVGGAGETDVAAEAAIGIGRYSLVIDCKTTGKDRVAEAQISFLAIDEHRKQRNADYALVVAPDFAGGNLTTRAASFQLGLLKTEHLAEIVRVHAETPLSLDDLRPLFEKGSVLDSSAVHELRAASHQLRRRWVLLSALVDQVAAWALLVPDKVIAQPTSLFATLLGSSDERLKGVTLDEVEDALSVLSSGSVGVFRRVRNGIDGYCLTMSVASAGKRLSRLGSFSSATVGRSDVLAEPDRTHSEVTSFPTTP